MKRLGRILFYWLPPAAWAAAIFGLSSLSLPSRPSVYPFEDKVSHALIFAVLALMILRALREGQRMNLGKAAVLAFAFASLYGALDEAHQHFVPLRKMDAADWLADTVGAAVVFLAARWSIAGSGDPAFNVGRVPTRGATDKVRNESAGSTETDRGAPAGTPPP